MSQQRSCCCNPEQDFGLACLHSDKLTPPAGLREYSKKDYQAGWSTQFYSKFVEPFNVYRTGLRTVSPSTVSQGMNDYGPPNSPIPQSQIHGGLSEGEIDIPATTGQGCMLCQGSLIMSFKGPTSRRGGTVVDANFCNFTPNCSTYVTRYNTKTTVQPEEETMHVLYLAVKDVWYYERGPAGIPYSWFDATKPPLLANGPISPPQEPPQYWTALDRLGKRDSSTPNNPFRNCQFNAVYIPPIQTDADYLCYPELTACTNPANPFFGPHDSTGVFGGGQEQTNAWNTINGVANTNPELADYNIGGLFDWENYPSQQGWQDSDPMNYVCSQLESNTHPWGFNGSLGPFPFFTCGGVYQPGFSSWQMYQMRKDPALRHLGDTVTYGNGLRVFRTPSEVLTDPEGSLPSDPNLYTSGYGSLMGTLYRARIWVKADKYINSDYEFPCTDSNNRTVAYHPPKTNERMMKHWMDGGYPQLAKSCASGPSILVYTCSGVPVYTSDLRDEYLKGNINAENINDLVDFYNGNFTKGSLGVDSSEGWYECNVIPGIEQSLGETGRFVAKDWRRDQVEKYSTLEREFKAITEAVTEGEPGFALAQQYAEGIPLPDSIKQYLIPQEVTDEKSGNITIQENELLPVQKYGQEFLSFMINRARPKELATGEGDNTEQDILLTEMPYYQASAFDGTNFEIDSYDPWHPNNTGADWPLLGTKRQDIYPIVFNNPGGIEGEFNFRYPIRDAYVNAYPDIDFSNDTVWRQWVPEWEEKLFESWYKNNPVYIHACSGGWSWSGLGQYHEPRLVDPAPGQSVPKEQCRWSTNLLRLDKLESLQQLDRNTSVTPGAGLVANVPPPYDEDLERWTGLGNYDTCDGFPNYVWSQNIPQAASGQGGSYWNLSAQLRNKRSRVRCHTLNDICTSAGPDSGGCVRWCPAIDDCEGDSCCCKEEEEQGPVQGGSKACGCVNDGDPIQIDNGGGVLRNCCNVSSPPYTGRKAEGGLPLGKATSAISSAQPTSVGNRSSKQEIDSWNRINPETKMGDSSFYGIRCSESGGCPIGYKCCCPSGCGGDCFCIPESNDCDTPPCVSQFNFNTSCCQTFGSCCYEEDGELKCIDNITEEQCIARKSLGGLDGIFNKDSECSVGQCPTTTVRGACFYTDKLLDHQICRQTTEQACAGLSGEFHANQKCSEFPDKKTTGYEDVSGRVGVRPNSAGDRTCGRFGYAVNCCTEEIDEDTGEFVRTCEVKCISDCDTKAGASRIVSSCESCGELGHCCTKDGYCRPNVTEADCFGTWYPGPDCDAESCITTGVFDTEADRDLKYPRRSAASDDTNPDTGDGSGGGAGGGAGGGGAGGGGGGLSPVCTSCENFTAFGANTEVCLTGYSNQFMLSGQYDPSGKAYERPLPLTGCRIASNKALSNSCAVRSIQVTKIGFRHVVYASIQDADGLHGGCPVSITGTFDKEDSCCDAICNPAYFSSVNCSTPDPLDVDSIHKPVHTMEVTVYPYKLRCQQVRDSAGFWVCGILAEQLKPNQTTDYAVGVAGLSDFLNCHDFKRTFLGGTVVEETQFCTDGPSPCDSNGTCSSIGNGLITTVDTLVGGSSTFGFSLNHSSRKTKGAFCPNYGNQLDLRRAFSIPFLPPARQEGNQHVYSPEDGIGFIPKLHCLQDGTISELNSTPTQPSEGSVFSECAEFYNDKLLQDISTFVAPPPYEELIFHDYGGLTNGDITNWMCQSDLDGSNANWFKGASAEYVDAQFDDSLNPNEFWIKKQFPDLQYIRLFGAGCYNLPGSFEGGRTSEVKDSEGNTYPSGGDFAGTMVLAFGTTTEFQKFDEVYGSENLELTFETVVPNQPQEEPLGGSSHRYSFVAQPSFNINKDSDFNGDGSEPGAFNGCSSQEESSDECPPYNINNSNQNTGRSCSYSEIGFLNGRGLTYANVENGEVGDYNGKVYEFCSYLNVNAGVDDELGGQLKPIFRLPDDEIPSFSGVRGPVVLYARNEDGQQDYNMTVTLKRFDVIENNECGFCYSQIEGDPLYGGLMVDSATGIAILRTKEECLTIDPQNSGNDRQFFPNVSGITTGGALGCCTHEIGDPLDMSTSSLPSAQPCNSWQEKSDVSHSNPARTFGNGDCICDEQP